MRVFFVLLAWCLAAAQPAKAEDWTLEAASKPYRGVTVDVVFLLRPGYQAIQELIPEFEETTGISINVTPVPYASALSFQALEFVSEGDLDVALIDLVWLGAFVDSEWIVPLDTFLDRKELVDPDLNLTDFFPLLLDAFGAWNGVQYGLPFDNYSGLLFYNRCMLEDAGFNRPPETWHELKEVYGPALTRDGRYAFALQSAQNETQAADSFARFLWPFGGSFLDDEFRSNLTSMDSLRGLEFRQSLLPFMPENITTYDHAEVVDAFTKGHVAMITEWSAFYPTIAESEVADCLGAAPEPRGPVGRRPALGGFSLAVASQADEREQAAAWLFIQWATSKSVSYEYLKRGGVPARRSTLNKPGVRDEFPFVKSLVVSWRSGVSEFRPRFAEWTIISPMVQLWGVRIQRGEISPEDGARILGIEMEGILAKSGYYNGSRELLQ